MNKRAQGVLPTDEQMLKLKTELNFLFWTTDVPEVPRDFPVAVQFQTTPEPAKINMQCTSHAIVTAAIFMALSFGVTTRAGMAFVLDTSADGNPDNDFLNQIGKHWWITLDDHGLVDLSLSAETENPLVYCNRSVSGNWRVAFGKNQQELNVFLKARQRGCFYLTANKQKATASALTQSLAQPVAPAKKHGIHIPYANIVRHCEELLSGAGQSLTSTAQVEAWRKLAS